MTPFLEPSTGRLTTFSRTGWPGTSRVLWQLLKLAAFALLAYAVWRGYQNPDLILDYGGFRLC